MDGTVPSRRRLGWQIVLAIGFLWLTVGAGALGAWLATVQRPAGTAADTTSSQRLPDRPLSDVAEVAQRVSPSVVSIIVEQSDPRSARQQAGAGTGMIISADGYILTNKHVVNGARAITIITSAGERFSDVRLVGVDPLNDVAFVKINGAQGLPAVQLGDSGSVAVGQRVVAIGNSLGQYQNTVTSGVISGKGRPISAALDDKGFEVEHLTDLLQTDAAINPGNSGGPLIDMQGRVIGINTAIVSDAQSIGFAIPINATKGMVRGVLADGTVKKAFVGVRYVAITPEIRAQHQLRSSARGAFVGGQRGNPVQPGGPADKAGLKQGDIITKINQKIVGEHGGLGSLIAEFLPGETIRLTVLRGDKEHEVSLTLGSYRS